MDDERSLLELLDDDVTDYGLRDWRARNGRLFSILADMRLVDRSVVPQAVVEHLMNALINVRVGAANDPQNAGHVRAQNENVIHFSLAANVDSEITTVALVAGFVHDMNKSLGERLRRDEYAVTTTDGTRLDAMTTLAQLVGLNHLGDRTRAAIEHAVTEIPAFDRSVGERVDRCIIHHGLGSSRFIRDLIEGNNPWWGHEFVDQESGAKKLVHPPQPPPTLESLVHDLADSAQQMQAGGAWLLKYPSGYWVDSGRSYGDMFSGESSSKESGPIPMSLKLQIAVETATCLDLIATAVRQEVIDAEMRIKLEGALDMAAAGSRAWVDDDPESLAREEGSSVYHDIGRERGISAAAAKKMLDETHVGTQQARDLDDLIWRSSRRVESERAQGLAARISRR